MKLLLFFLLPVIAFISCTKTVRQQPVHNIKVLGHGGMGNTSSMPMNSLESILACYHSGADGTEMDVQMTADGQLVAFHDLDLSGNTNLKGMVNAMSWEELSRGYYRENPYLNYKIASIEQILVALQSKDALGKYLLTFDCKLYNDQTEDFESKYIQALLSLIQRFNLEQQVIIESQDENFLKELQSANSLLRLFIYAETAEDGIRICRENGFTGISISTRNITKEEISSAREQNLEVAIWNTHTKKDNREAVDKEPDYIQTEKITYLLDLLY